jgi:hypothetical protein
MLACDNQLAEHNRQRWRRHARENRRRMNGHFVQMRFAQGSIRAALSLHGLIQKSNIAIKTAQEALQHQHVILLVFQITLYGIVLMRKKQTKQTTNKNIPTSCKGSACGPSCCVEYCTN